MKRILLMPSFSAFFLSVMPLITSSLLSAWVIQNEMYFKNLMAWQWIVVTLLCTLTSALALTPPTFLAFGFGYFLGWESMMPLILLNLAAILMVHWATRWLHGTAFATYILKWPSVKELMGRVYQNEITFVF
ncbi:MAG: hypothetical protein ACK4GN_09475, partial [Runella sp.]